jgi:putative hydrolase of the HAD superfamily
MIRAILFDLDETLHDRRSTVERALQEQHARLHEYLGHIPLETYLQRFIELDNVGRTPKPQVYGRLVEEFAIPLSPTLLSEDYYRHTWRQPVLFPLVRDLLAHYRQQGHGLAIVTNGSTRSQQAKLANSGLDQLVDIILISEQEGVAKPTPTIFLRAARQPRGRHLGRPAGRHEDRLAQGAHPLARSSAPGGRPHRLRAR